MTDKPKETKAQKFERLAVNRMGDVLYRLEQLGKLGNRATYEYTPEQVGNMFQVIHDKSLEAMAKFDPPLPKERKEKEHPTFAFESNMPTPTKEFPAGHDVDALNGDGEHLEEDE